MDAELTQIVGALRRVYADLSKRWATNNWQAEGEADALDHIGAALRALGEDTDDE